MKRIAVVIPSIRKFEHWDSYRQQLPKKADVFVCGETVNASGIKRCKFFGREDFDKCPNSLRGLDYIYAKIWKSDKYDAVISFDDDTVAGVSFFQRHLDALNRTQFTTEYMNPLDGAYARGIPYGDRRTGRVVLHQGLWNGEGDINVMDKLIELPRPGEPRPVAVSAKWKSPGFMPLNFGVVPHGKAVTISSMNISFRPEIIPALYQVPMFRWDDIWSGLILKRIADHLGDHITFGTPFVTHLQAPRDPLRDLALERRGFAQNERLWKQLMDIEIDGDDYFECAWNLASNLEWDFANGFRAWVRYLDKL